MNAQKLKVICPKCKKPFALIKPEKPGAYKVKCVHCQKFITLMLRPVEVKMPDQPKEIKEEPKAETPQKEAFKAEAPKQEAPKQEAPKQEAPKQEAPKSKESKAETQKAETSNMEELPDLGKAELSNRGVFKVSKPATVGVKSRFACPKCGEPVLVNFSKEGKSFVKCTHCGTRTAVKVESQSSTEEEKIKKNTRKLNEEKAACRGQLVWGSFFCRKRHELRDGVTIIGRNDQEAPSDLMFEDPTMSCRSVQLEVDTKDGSCKLTVLRATNPVCVNGVSYPEGSSIYLSFNDTLKMGKTTIIYNKIK